MWVTALPVLRKKAPPESPGLVCSFSVRKWPLLSLDQ